MLPWIEPDHWAPGVKSLVAEVEPLIETLAVDDVGLNLWGFLGGLTVAEQPGRLRALRELSEELHISREELAPHQATIARCLARIASSTVPGRHLAAMKLLELTQRARTDGRQHHMLPLGWLDGWATSRLSPMWPYADAIRDRLGGATREPSYFEVVFEGDLFSDFMERADTHDACPCPDAPVSLRLLYEAVEHAELETAGPTWRVSGAPGPMAGGAWFRLRRLATYRHIGHAGVAIAPGGEVRLSLAFEPVDVPARHDYASEIVAAIARHAMASMGVECLLAGPGEEEALRTAGFRRVDGLLALTREAFARMCTLEPVPDG